MISLEEIPVFILAGGLGTRISEETTLKPKPMVEIGQIPILLHVMRIYYRQGFNDFVICSGYRSWEIKQFFLSYEFRMNHLSIDHRKESTQPPMALGRSSAQEKWRVRVIETGVDCMTGGRLARALDLISATQHFSQFALTYGDGLSDVNLKAELAHHEHHKKIGTVLGVSQAGRFGVLDTDMRGAVTGFLEKPEAQKDVISGGFFFFKNTFRNYLSNDKSCILERHPLENLSRDRELMVYRHHGFWHPMDTLRDKNFLEGLWEKGNAPWTQDRETSTQESDLIPTPVADVSYDSNKLFI